MSTQGNRLQGRFLAIAAGAVLCGSSAANAVVLYSTGFNSPTYTNGGLVAQDGWAAHSGAGTNAIQVTNALTNGIVSLTTSGEDVNHGFAGQTAGTSVYLTAEITLSAAQAAGDYFIHMGDGGGTNLNARVYARSSGGGFQMAMGTGSGTPTYGTTVLAFGTTYTILARYDIIAGLANDTGALYINPADPFGVGDTPYVAATTIGTDATTLAGVYLRQGTAANAATVSSIDNISVQVVPAPASLALLGLGGLIAARRRRA